MTTPIFPSRLLMKGHWREKEKPGVRNQLKALSGINWISICMERALGAGRLGFGLSRLMRGGNFSSDAANVSILLKEPFSPVCLR